MTYAHLTAVPTTARPSRLRRRCGMVQIGAAFLIMGILTLGTFAVIGAFRSSAYEENATNEISLISQKTRTLYAGAYGKYGTREFTTDAIKNGVFPTNSVVGGSTVDNAYGGKIKLNGINGGQRFTMTYTEVPATSCKKLATLGLGFLEVKIDGTTLTVPMNMDDVTAACAASDSAKTIVYTMN